MAESEDLTQLLFAARGGDQRAVDQLLPRLYDVLRALAGAMLHHERMDHTLQATALVHEAYLKLVDQTRVQWRDRAHFFAVASQALRRILVDHARTHRRAKRGGGKAPTPLHDQLVDFYERQVDLLALDEAMSRLAERHPNTPELWKCAFSRA